MRIIWILAECSEKRPMWALSNVWLLWILEVIKLNRLMSYTNNVSGMLFPLILLRLKVITAVCTEASGPSLFLTVNLMSICEGITSVDSNPPTFNQPYVRQLPAARPSSPYTLHLTVQVNLLCGRTRGNKRAPSSRLGGGGSIKFPEAAGWKDDSGLYSAQLDQPVNVPQCRS